MRYVLTNKMWLVFCLIGIAGVGASQVTRNPFSYVMNFACAIVGINLAFTKETK